MPKSNNIRNFRFIVSYDGTRYLGWEHQPNTEMTIQGKLEAVLEGMLAEERAAVVGNGGKPDLPPGKGAAVVGFGPSGAEDPAGRENSPWPDRTAVSDLFGVEDFPQSGGSVTVIGAGRTDAGVHARAMTANARLDTRREPAEIMRYMNRYLPDDISVNEVSQVSDRFHSRYNAIGKTYRYTLWFDPDGSLPVFDRKYVTVLKEAPDMERMRSAAERLIGQHDFKSFCGNSHMKKSTVRTVDVIRVESSGHYIRVYCHGDGFLQNMVRILTGTLLECGYGRLSPEDMDRILGAKDRRLAGPTMPAKGLCLMKVDY